MSVDPFIEAEEAAGHSVKNACHLLEVSRAAYYQRRKGVPSARKLSDAELAEQITAVHAESKGTYGSPRVHQELHKRGVDCGKRRVRRLMLQAGLEGRCKKRWRRTTVADPAAEVALDLIQRAFGPGADLDRRYVGDITLESPSCGVGTDQPHAHPAGHRCPHHGASQPRPRQGAHLPLGPRLSGRIPVVVATPR
jgi:transposase InsO family protein